MDKETQKRIVREQRAGHEWLERKKVEMLRQMTFEDRLRDFNNIVALARILNLPEPSRADDDEVTEKWIRIRERYAATR